MPSIDQIDRLQAEARASGFEIVLDFGDVLGDSARYFYADTRKFLGHYIEYLYHDTQALAFFDQVVPSY